jgi:hypothetical protein
MQGSGVHLILSNPLKYSSPKILFVPKNQTCHMLNGVRAYTTVIYTMIV